jgi:putative transcriptional regulator
MREIAMSKVAELRKRANLTQRQLAQKIGVTETTIRNWENNRNGVEALERIVNLCKALNCDVSELVEYKKLDD